jgi:integrase
MLTDAKIKAAKPRDKAYKLGDGRGLSLLVRPTGARWWRYRFAWEGREQMLSLGTYPDTGLSLARSKRDDAAKLLAAGINPSEHRKQEREARSGRFEDIAEPYWRNHAPSLSEGTRVRDVRIYRALVGELNGRPLSKLESKDVVAALRAIKENHGHSTARRARGLAERVFAHASAGGIVSGNPAAGLSLEAAIGKHVSKRRPGITDPGRFAELLRAIDTYTGTAVTVAALKLQTLVFVRPGRELLKARWREFDLKGARWTIPAERMKMRNTNPSEHLVPLSTQAQRLMRELAWVTNRGADTLVFPGLNAGKPLSENTLNQALRRMDFDTKTEHCAHGFRTSASTMLRERLQMSGAWVEMQLAHVVPGVEGLYNRADYLTDRVAMMQRWADYLDELRG